MVGHGDDAVDLGRLAVGAGLAGGVDQHLHGRPDEVLAAARGDGILQLRALADALGHQLGGHLAVEVGGIGAGLVAEGEEPDPVELGLLDPGQQPVVVLLGLAGVADDEGGPESGGGLGRPDRPDPVEEPVALAPAAHALE